MILKGHKQRYYKRLFFYHGLPRVQSPTCTVCRARHLKKKMTVQTPRSRIPVDTLWEEHLVSHMRMFSLMCQNINLFTKISLECWLCFRLYLWRTQN